MFPVYLELGFHHIVDLNGYDHILFIVALCAIYAIADWKKILILVTAFTIGHSVTLALSALHILNLSPYLIELMIPVTILLTALQNFMYKPLQPKRINLQYILALVFGFIHGMGFSNYFRSLLGLEADIKIPLLAFNIGVEIGQICIVVCLLFLNFLIVKIGRLRQQYWNYTVSSVAIVLSLIMIAQRF